MPPNPENVEEHVDLTQPYHEDGSFVDFYTNSAMAIGRDREDPNEGVWLDSNEKRELYEALDEYYGESRECVGTVTVGSDDPGLDLLADLNAEYEVVVDGVHGDGQVTYVVYTDNDD